MCVCVFWLVCCLWHFLASTCAVCSCILRLPSASNRVTLPLCPFPLIVLMTWLSSSLRCVALFSLGFVLPLSCIALPLFDSFLFCLLVFRRGEGYSQSNSPGTYLWSFLLVAILSLSTIVFRLQPDHLMAVGTSLHLLSCIAHSVLSSIWAM